MQHYPLCQNRGDDSLFGEGSRGMGDRTQGQGNPKGMSCNSTARKEEGMKEAIILQCLNVMHDSFREIARTDDNPITIRAFLNAYDKAYFELIKDVQENNQRGTNVDCRCFRHLTEIM